MGIVLTFVLVVCSTVMLGDVVAQVLGTGVPYDTDGFVLNLIHHPKVSHFHGERALSFDGTIGNADGRFVVTMNRCRWLWMSHFFEDDAEDFGFLRVEEEGAELSFRGGGGHVLQHGAQGVDGSIELNRLIVFGVMAHEVMATSRAAGLGLVDVRGIRVNLKNHVGRIKTDDSVGMGGEIIKEMRGSAVGCLGGLGLLA